MAVALTAGSPITWAEVPRRLTPLIQRLGAAISGATQTADRKSAARSLLSAFDLLSEVSASIGKAERLRPLIGYWRRADDIIEAVDPDSWTGVLA
jgi:hypothetical protein